MHTHIVRQNGYIYTYIYIYTLTAHPSTACEQSVVDSTVI